MESYNLVVWLHSFLAVVCNGTAGVIVMVQTASITRSSRHKRRATGGAQSPYRKKRKFEMVG